MTTSGILAFDALEFGTDVDAPYLQNRNPAPSSVDQPTTLIYLEIVDDDTGVSLPTVHIELNVDGGGWEDAYVASAFVNPYDDGSSQGAASPNGYSLNIVPDVAFGQGVVVQVRVTAEDAIGNTLGPVTYQFSTALPPYTTLRDPDTDATNVARAHTLTLRIRDDGSGLDQDETLIRLDTGGGLTPAYDHDGGGFQAPFTGTYSEIAAGLEYEIAFDNYVVAEGQIVTVDIHAQDVNGTAYDDSYVYTMRQAPPYLANESPAPGAAVPFLEEIYLDALDDDSGVDLTTVLMEVRVNGGGYQDAYVGATDTFPAPFDGVNSARGAVAGGYSFNVHTTAPFTWGDVVDVRVNASDLDGNAMPEVIYSITLEEGIWPEGYRARSQGLIPAITRAIGYADDVAGGLRATRLTAPVAVGDVALEVETTHEWPAPGKISIDGVVYEYTGFASPTLTGITHLAGGVAVPGAKAAHRVESTVVDLSQTYSDMNLLRRALLVDYAEGDQLAVIGRNLGVVRYPELDDQEQYRALIKALAYNPKATMFGIELMLNALLGAGNYELWDDPETAPHVVYVKVVDALSAVELEYGKAFVSEPLAVAATADTTADLPAAPKSVTGARWADENLHTETETARPSAQVITDYEGDLGTSPWEFVGGTEATEVSILTADGGCIAWETTAAAYYKHPARCMPETELRGVGLLATIGSSAALDVAKADQACLIVRDGARAYGWGVIDDTGSTYALGLFDPDAGTIVGSTVVLARGVYHDLELQVHDGQVHLLVDQRGVLAEDYTGFPVSALHRVDFGVLAAGLAGAPHLRVKRARVGLRTSTDYWASGAAAGAVATADPDRLTVVKASAFINPDDVSKKLTIRGGTAANSYGGTNNGDFEVAVVATAQVVDLRGAARTGARVTSLDPDLFNAEDDEAFLFPRDLGKKVVVTSGDAAGTYYVKQLLHVISQDDLAGRDTLTEERTGLAVLEVSPGTPADFTSEQDLSWRLDPNFVDESGLTWELSDAGTFSGATVTLRDALPILSSAYARVLSIRRSEVNSAQLLPDRDTRNEKTQTAPVLFRYYPFYLADPLGYIRNYLELVTAAGVHPEIVTE